MYRLMRFYNQNRKAIIKAILIIAKYSQFVNKIAA